MRSWKLWNKVLNETYVTRCILLQYIVRTLRGAMVLAAAEYTHVNVVCLPPPPAPLTLATEDCRGLQFYQGQSCVTRESWCIRWCVPETVYWSNLYTRNVVCYDNDSDLHLFVFWLIVWCKLISNRCEAWSFSVRPVAMPFTFSSCCCKIMKMQSTFLTNIFLDLSINRQFVSLNDDLWIQNNTVNQPLLFDVCVTFLTNLTEWHDDLFTKQ